MNAVEIILLIAGIILVVLGAFRIGTPRLDLGWLGTALVFTAVFLLPHLN